MEICVKKGTLMKIKYLFISIVLMMTSSLFAMSEMEKAGHYLDSKYQAARASMKVKVAAALREYQTTHSINDLDQVVTANISQYRNFAPMLTFKALFPDRDPDNPLHHAIANNDMDLFKYALLHGADVNGFDVDGRSPLRHAIDQDRFEMIRKLLDAPNLDMCPVITAAKEPHPSVMRSGLEVEPGAVEIEHEDFEALIKAKIHPDLAPGLAQDWQEILTTLLMQKRKGSICRVM